MLFIEHLFISNIPTSRTSLHPKHSTISNIPSSQTSLHLKHLSIPNIPSSQTSFHPKHFFISSNSLLQSFLYLNLSKSRTASFLKQLLYHISQPSFYLQLSFISAIQLSIFNYPPSSMKHLWHLIYLEHRLLGSYSNTLKNNINKDIMDIILKYPFSLGFLQLCGNFQLYNSIYCIYAKYAI